MRDLSSRSPDLPLSSISHLSIPLVAVDTPGSVPARLVRLNLDSRLGPSLVAGSRRRSVIRSAAMKRTLFIVWLTTIALLASTAAPPSGHAAGWWGSDKKSKTHKDDDDTGDLDEYDARAKVPLVG